MEKKSQTTGGATGVDLNRNFGTYNFWNSTNGGSSTSPSSDTYRGTLHFPNRKTQVFKTFVNSRNFKTDLIIIHMVILLLNLMHGATLLPTPDDAIFNEMGGECTVENHYSFWYSLSDC